MKLKIDGKEVLARPGMTVLDAARTQGIYIPNLCAFPGLSPYGGCRLCLVEIKGRKGFVPACCTPVENELEILSDTPELQHLRRMNLELILSEHPHACLICSEKKNCEEYKSTIRKVGEVTGCVLCPRNGRCDLQKVVEAVRIERVRFPATYHNLEIRREDPFFDRNYNLCILCGRCVRVCSEVRGAAAVSFIFRGPKTVVGTSYDRPLLESGCQFCGACVDVCPTGALTERENRGEILPDEKRETICPFCSVGCTLEVDLRQGRMIRSLPKECDSVNLGQACVKGRFLLREVVYSPKRILKPMIRWGGTLREVSWDEALEEVAKKLAPYREGKIQLVISTQSSLEDQYVGLKFARRLLHTNPLADFIPLPAFSFQKWELEEPWPESTLPFEFNLISESGLILLGGPDISLFQPVLWVEVLKALRNGARLITVGSFSAAVERRAAVSLSSDQENKSSILLALLFRCLERNSGKEAWISGLPRLKASLDRVKTYMESNFGRKIERELTEAALLLAERKPAVFLTGPEIETRPGGKTALQALWNLALICGARLISVALSNNERGVLELFRSPSGGKDSARSSLPEPGERADALYCAGFLPEIFAREFKFKVVQGCFWSEPMEGADAILPATTFAESEGHYVNVQGRIQNANRIIEPLGEARPDWWIFCRLAEKMGAPGFDWKSSTDITAELARGYPVFREIPLRPQKKNRPVFLTVEKKKPAEIVAVDPSPAEEGSGATSENPGRLQDFYRGLDLAAESWGLRSLREAAARAMKKRRKTGEERNG